MNRLPGLENAAAIILSCPGPLRRHPAALIPLREVRLPQVLLGAESQLLAFAAAASHLAERLFFAPLPEMFPGVPSLRAAWRRVGGSGRGRLVHLRFGGVRAARVLKGVQNACVVAEAGGTPPLTASHHPFASGTLLPTAIERLFIYGATGRPRSLDGTALPATRLSGDCITADLLAWSPDLGQDGPSMGLDLVSLAEFRSVAWAAGTMRSRGTPGLTGGDRGAVLLPWNMDHPGSIVPDLLERLARLHAPGGALRDATPLPRIVLLPFNYIGQTGIIRQLITRLRQAAHAPEAFLSDVFLARIASLTAIAQLRALASRAWVDGNDPEHWWTLARFSACGITPILIDPHHPRRSPGCLRLPADEAIWVDAETRCGKLTFGARLPSLHALPALLALTSGGAGRPGLVAVR